MLVLWRVGEAVLVAVDAFGLGRRGGERARGRENRKIGVVREQSGQGRDARWKMRCVDPVGEVEGFC